MSDVRRVIKSIRRVGKKPPVDPPTELDIKVAEWKDDTYTYKFWERDKKIKRDQNFERMKLAREEQLEQKRLSKLREEEIKKNRLLNLKKARKALKKKRRSNG